MDIASFDLSGMPDCDPAALWNTLAALSLLRSLS